MNTDVMMLRELNDKFEPKQRGFLSAEEVKMIKETLHIEEMDILQLRNLRNTTVLFLKSIESHSYEMSDKISAITHVIDTEIWNKGGEV